MMRMPRLVRRIFWDRSANATVVVAFSILSLIGGAGLATDTIQWALTKRQLQRMADSGALAGAFAAAKGSSASSAASTELGRYSLLTLSNTNIETPPGSGSYSGNGKAVRVTLNANKALPFSSMFMSNTPSLQATATAAAVGFGTYCVISLESTTATGVNFSGSSNVTLGCGVSTNSQGTTAVNAGGSSTISASPVSAVGVVPASNNYASGTTLNSYSISQPDPYSAVGLPTGYNCSNQLNVQPSNGNGNQTTRVQNNGNGIQCYRGMDLKGAVTFDPGTYIIDGSTGNGLNVGAGAVVNCTGCTFIFTTTSNDMTTIATARMNGNSTWNVSAPETGTYAGIMMYQDRRAISGTTNFITGDSNSFFQGAVYFPSQEVQFTGNSSMNSKCLQIVARTVTFTGSNYIQNVCPTNSNSKAIAGIQIRLVD
ncbi:pilus assembly protein TadG-related protein [Novosphingobium bradum]|uniref:Pilus assembly protein TadG-related protein n=1 Tax=Novosphingobium bradum TaxID=1737444 RepID=A0ABV7IQS0_9SPHN